MSAIVPMINLLKHGVSESLDQDHSKTQSMKVSMTNENTAFPVNLMAASFFSVFTGIAIYFLLPLSLLTLDIGLLLSIFFALLVYLLFGSVLLSSNFNYLLESILLLFLFCERAFVKNLTRMNLISHRLRNRRTVIVFATSLSFINFIYVSIFMQIGSSQLAELRKYGSEFVL